MQATALLGETLAQRFLLEQELGRGGMGVVYRALDKWNGTACAVKVLEVATDARRFQREAQILSRLAHPAIVRYLGHGVSAGGKLFFAMEWVDGRDLARRLSDGALSVHETYELGRRLAEALKVVHAAGIVHRDLKPSNVFLPSGQVELAKLGDFGIAHQSTAPHSTTRLTATGILMGTPGYLAPEMLRGARVDARADLFALGCVLFECVTGRPAFVANSVIALLAKIALDPTPSARAVRADVPLELEELIAALLEKEPEARVATAEDVLLSFDKVQVSPGPGHQRLSSAPTLVGSHELRLVPLLICPARASVAGSTAEASVPVTGAHLQSLGYRTSVRLELLADQSIIGVPDIIAESPGEQALRVARLAHELLASTLPGSLAIVTGRMVVSSGLVVSALVDRAVSLVNAAPARTIAIDEGSASLLEARFQVWRGPTFSSLGPEKIDDAPRHLLGKATPFVGRSREFSLLFSTLEACIDESYARAMLVSGLPGIGKSRLLSELLSQAKARVGDKVSVLLARGDPDLMGQPFSLLGSALRRTAGIRADDGLDLRIAKLRTLVPPGESEASAELAFLAEIMGLDLPESFDPRLRAARRDPPAMSAMTRDAFTSWVRRASGKQGMLLAIDDLHWADAPSVQLIDAALGSLADVPLFVLVLGRPEVRENYPRLFEARDVAELKLGRLSKRASEELVTAILGSAASTALVAAIVLRAEGNAFFLEELIRAGASGDLDRLPDTVLGVLENRLADLETDARLVLRAASVFGESSWAGGVENVLGPERAVADVSGWLSSLAAREILAQKPVSRFAHEPEYVFRHALLRDASYATFRDSDRQVAHSRAADWLTHHGEGAAVVLASHWERSADMPRAVAAYVQAVEQALRSNDLESALALAERAERAGASGEQLGRVRILESDAYTWMGAPEQALRTASEAIDLLSHRDGSWFTALASAVEAAVLLGRPAAIDRLIDELVRTDRHEPSEASESQAAALGRASFALVLLGRASDAAALLEKADRIGEARPFTDAMTRGHVAHAHAAEAMSQRRLEIAARCYEQAAEAFESTGALRLASGARTNVAAMYLEMGAADLALHALEPAIATAERTGTRYTMGLAQLNRGIALGRLDRWDEAVQVLGDVREELERQGDRRLVASASCALAEVAIARGELKFAETEAQRAAAASSDLPSCHAGALATLALVQLRKGDVQQALETARLADAERQSTTMEEREVLLDLVLAEADFATGAITDAGERIARVARDLSSRAEQIAAPALREAFLKDVPEHRQVLELAERLGVGATRADVEPT